MLRGIFTVDPGLSTGVAWAILDNSHGTVAKAMSSRASRGSTTIAGEDEIEQANHIIALWDSFVIAAKGTKVDCVGEDYVISPGHAPGRGALIAVRVLWAFEGLRHGRDPSSSKIILQLPSAAMRSNTREILTPWDAWVKGRDHERSAHAHMGLRLMKIMNDTR